MYRKISIIVLWRKTMTKERECERERDGDTFARIFIHRKT